MDRRKKRKMLVPDMTPLIDIVFLLLIFFIVVSNFNQYGNLKIQLPKSGIVSEKEENKSLELILDGEGKYYIKDKNVQKEIILDELELNLIPDGEIVVTADKNVTYETLMMVFGKIKNSSQAEITLSAFR
ncbi:MAG: ExbD/TolR family protein [Fusobacteriaceae bacterium]